MIRPHNPSGAFPEVVIERSGYVTLRVLVNGVEVPSVRRIETVDDATDAPMVALTLYARVSYRDVDALDEREGHQLDDPGPMPECDVPGCAEQAAAGTPTAGGYRRTCLAHIPLSPEPEPEA